MDIPNTPQDTQVHKITMSDEYKEKALELVKAKIKGNKCKAEELVLEEFEGAILQFQAENRLTILKKITRLHKPGRIEGPVAVQSEAAANEEMHRAYMTLHDDVNLQRQIKKGVLKRDDQGFGVDNIIMPLTLWKKEFVVHEPCHTCKTTGTVTCLPCSGKGVEACPRCKGSGVEACSQCRGAQTVALPGGQLQQCPRCHGHGRSACTLCNQTGRVPCGVCKQIGTTPCPNCKGNAWTSHIYIVEIEAKTAFDYPRDRLPEKVVAMIDKYGANIKEHADIKVTDLVESNVNFDDAEKQREVSEAQKRGDLIIPIIYDVFLPQAHMDYSIRGKTYYTFLFGIQNKLEYASPFIDDLIKDGLRKLEDAAQERGDTADNLQQAAKYKTIREAIYYAANKSGKKAKALMNKRYAFGLSEKAIESMILNTQHAFKSITKKPRRTGLAVAIGLNLLLSSLYFLTPARVMFISKVPNTSLHLVLDGIVAFTFFYIGIVVIQTLSYNAVKTVTEKLKIKEPATPRLGTTLYMAAGSAALIFGGLMYLSKIL